MWTKTLVVYQKTVVFKIYSHVIDIYEHKLLKSRGIAPELFSRKCVSEKSQNSHNADGHFANGATQEAVLCSDVIDAQRIIFQKNYCPVLVVSVPVVRLTCCPNDIFIGHTFVVSFPSSRVISCNS